MAWLIAGALLALAYLGARLQTRCFLFQYLFFCRYPLAAALILAALPLAASGGLGEMVGNLFVLDARSLGIVVFLAVFAAWSATFATLLVYVSAPPCYKLYFLKGPAPESHQNPLPSFLEGRFGPSLGALFALPLIAVLAWRSPASIGERALAVAIGVAGALAVWYLWLLIVEREWDRGLARGMGRELQLVAGSRLGRRTARTKLARGVAGSSAVRGIAGAIRERRETYSARWRWISHFNALVFLGLAALIYSLVGYFAGPDSGWFLTAHLPPLAFVILLLITACLGLTSAAYWFDVYRVPVLLLVVVVSVLSYKLFDTDHYYALAAEKPEAWQGALDPAAAVRGWAKTHQESTHPALVVVTASGGGIKAAVWTAQVLSGVRADPEIGERFARSLVLLSTVSGGSVGAMYFVDGYEPGGPPAPDQAEEAVAKAATSSLSAVAWGWVYPDLWRAVFPMLAPEHKDRGWAVEQRWRRLLAVPETTVGEWREGVAQGWRPAQVFNATLVETGERLRISPLDDPPPAARGRVLRRSRNFRQLYQGKDVEVATAARLSATFPYVSPVARPILKGTEHADSAYHVADGGYVDNYGVATAREFLDLVIDPYVKELGRERVVLVEIRASPLAAEPKAESGRGWIQSMAGPLLTMMNVRSAGQLERNERELELSIERWEKRGAKIARVQFVLECEASLSWHLTETETRAIDAGWGSLENQEALAELRKLLL